MPRKISLFAFLPLLLAAHLLPAAGSPEQTPQAMVDAGDSRQLVEMPEETRRLMQMEMLDHLAALNEIIAHLASGSLAAAAKTAEARLGKSSMGKHRATGRGPGRFMPPAMRSIGWSMHEAASELALKAKDDDAQGAYNALQKITSACVACHYSFRTK